LKAELTIKFISILRKKVNKELIEKNPALVTSTKVTIMKLCKELDKYFNSKKIQTKTSFQLKTD